MDNHLKQVSLYTSSSICASLLTHPLDVIKVRLQTNTCNTPQLQLLKHSLKTYGLSFLYRGLRASVFRNGSFVTTKMYTYDLLKKQYEPKTFGSKVICGMGAGFIGSIVGTPSDLVMVRMQNNSIKYPTIMKTLQKTVSEDGYLGFFNGLSYTMIRAIIVTACQFAIYDHIKEELNKKYDNKTGIFIISSVTSSIITGILSNPIDVCKTRTMNNHVNGGLYTIIRKEGITALWKGLNANIGRQIPLNFIRFSFLEFFKKF